MKAMLQPISPPVAFAVISRRRMKWLCRFVFLSCVAGCGFFLLQCIATALLLFTLALLTLPAVTLFPQRFQLCGDGIIHHGFPLYQQAIIRWDELYSIQLPVHRGRASFHLHTRLMNAFHWRLVCFRFQNGDCRYFWCRHAAALIRSLEFAVFESGSSSAAAHAAGPAGHSLWPGALSRQQSFGHSNKLKP